MHRRLKTLKLALLAPFAAVGAILLAGCSELPNSGPSTDAVIDQGAKFQDEGGHAYEFIDLDQYVVDSLSSRGNGSFAQRFGDHRGSGEPVIGVGDGVTVTIWEASAGGLFSAPTASTTVSAGANSAAIPEQFVGRDGSITVPYAGRVRVAGHTAREVQTVIEHSLEGKAIQPQVLVNVSKPISNSVTVGGEGVSAGARVPLSVKGDRVLDVIASAGGIRTPANETYVELARGHTTARVALVRIIADPRENIYLRPGDYLTLVHDPQTFIAYGASGANREISFGGDNINLAQALSKAGGLLDARSDPRGVFVFRYESPAVVRAIKPDSQLARNGREVPVVYRLDLSNPNSLFLEQKFHMASRDLIYISNAPTVELQKVVNIFTGVMAPAGQSASVVSAAGAL